MSTYSARPFISYDGPDENGVRAEVKVTKGFGNVSTIEPSAAGKAFKVSFSVENTKYETSGWAPLDSAVLKKVQEAKERGEPIHFRVETRRKPNIDRTTPIAELSDLSRAKDSIVKSLAAVKFDEDAEWTISQQAVTHMAEDPPTGGNGIYKATAPDLNKPGNSAPAPWSGPGEPPPYVTTLKNGNINPGSMAVAVPINLLAFVAEWDREHDEPVGEKKRAVVAKALLSAANELQLKIYEGELEKPDLSAGSHTRARALLFEVIRAYYPLTSEVVESKESLVEWRNKLIEKSLSIWKWGISEAQHFC